MRKFNNNPRVSVQSGVLFVNECAAAVGEVGSYTLSLAAIIVDPARKQFDYDGDGKYDYAVYRSGTWYLQRSSLGFIGIGYGASTD